MIILCRIYVLIDESVQVDIEKYPKDIRVLAEMLEEFDKVLARY